MKPGDRVWWFDPINGKVRSGTLLEKQHVISLAEANEDYVEDNALRFKPVDEWVWEIQSGGGQYIFPEELLSLEPLAN